ncbi:MAG: SAM-dependent methyltransferase [Proteobacteria bacterium]|nr:MAG: SAM-dependent methyltransferase [Pseudomonadota bacterium]
MRFELPEPDAAAREHSNRLVQLIGARLAAAGGWLDFADYMDLALYAPGLGYYSAGSAKFGAAGDFVTAPEISPLFARCLARAIAPLLRARAAASVLELGAGSGALAAELIPALLRLGVAPARYLILEVSADLRERQRALLLPARRQDWPVLEWLDALPDAPLDGVMIANEVADALPVSRFTIGNGAVQALGVCATADGFGWAARPAPPDLAARLSTLLPGGSSAFAEGYRSEISPRLPGWIAALAATLGEGALVLCDYGHDDPFFLPGLQDITAWVDFTTVAEAAQAQGLTVAGYATQAHFLLDAGLDLELAGDGAGVPLQLAQQARTLLLPGEMGERFKVMALTRGTAPLRGFGFRDLRHSL